MKNKTPLEFHSHYSDLQDYIALSNHIARWCSSTILFRQLLRNCTDGKQSKINIGYSKPFVPEKVIQLWYQ